MRVAAGIVVLGCLSFFAAGVVTSPERTTEVTAGEVLQNRWPAENLREPTLGELVRLVDLTSADVSSDAVEQAMRREFRPASAI